MTATETKSSRRNALLETLSATYPVFRDCQPLALGIHKTVKEKMPELEAAPLRVAMRIHTASTRYLKALAIGAQRFDLDGNPAGEITAEQRDVASEALKERFKKAGERRKIDEQAKKDALREQEAEAKRHEKLSQLAAKFNSR